MGAWPERSQKGPFGAISALLGGAEEAVPVGPEKARIGPSKICSGPKCFGEGTRGLCRHRSQRLVALAQHGVTWEQASFAQAQVAFGIAIRWPKRPSALLHPQKTTFSHLYCFDLCPRHSVLQFLKQLIQLRGKNCHAASLTCDILMSFLCPWRFIAGRAFLLLAQRHKHG